MTKQQYGKVVYMTYYGRLLPAQDSVHRFVFMDAKPVWGTTQALTFLSTDDLVQNL